MGQVCIATVYRGGEYRIRKGVVFVEDILVYCFAQTLIDSIREDEE